MTKLVTILARELGEWPDEATGEYDVKFITQDEDADICSWENDGPLIFDDGVWRIGGSIAVEGLLVEGAQLAEDFSTAIITREMWQAERERLSAPEWGGEGLPPIGSRVDVAGEVQYGAGEVNCEVVAHVEGCAVIRMTYGLGCFTASVLRPTKSARDKWIEAASQACKGMLSPEASILRAIYDAGLAKEVE